MNLFDKFKEGKDNFDNLTEGTKNFVANIGSFQKNTLMIATCILILLLVIVGILMLNSKKEEFPPHISPCPDYWVSSNYFKDDDNAYDKLTGSGDIKTIIENIPEGDTHCVNIHDVGKETCGKNMNFFTDEYEGVDGDCKKRDWAKSCNLTWDGITNNSELKDC
tara:strand:+ start:85 stop:576 length:492 start_codon:yes stop_codon:yes gene_type:complete